MQDVTKLRVYGAAEDLAVHVYGAARLLPAEERFALGQQLRRSAVSVGSNIAEGCGRSGSPTELTHFLRIALGSATELQFQLGIAVRLTLLEPNQIKEALASCQSVQRMLTRLIMAVRPATEASRGRPKTDNR